MSEINHRTRDFLPDAGLLNSIGLNIVLCIYTVSYHEHSRTFVVKPAIRSAVFLRDIRWLSKSCCGPYSKTYKPD